MATIEEVRHNLIDKLLTIKSKKLLEDIYKILQSQKEENIDLSEEQIQLLMMSEEDIKYNRMVPHEDIDKNEE